MPTHRPVPSRARARPCHCDLGSGSSPSCPTPRSPAHLGPPAGWTSPTPRRSPPWNRR
ncbi:hypothetical protein HBB16_02915 [Pseudonocardia sp. MCCB 268]|nr:hypothetical protein [Pseudonocardia cytotoxica]